MAGFTGGLLGSTLSAADLWSAVTLYGSVSAAARSTGIPRSTLRRALGLLVGTPRPATQERLFQAFTRPEVTVRPRSTAVDRLLWTASALDTTAPPHGAVAFKVVFSSNRYSSGYETTEAFDLRLFDPGSAVDLLGIDPSDVRRIIYDVGG